LTKQIPHWFIIEVEQKPSD